MPAGMRSVIAKQGARDAALRAAGHNITLMGGLQRDAAYAAIPQSRAAEVPQKFQTPGSQSGVMVNQYGASGAPSPGTVNPLQGGPNGQGSPVNPMQGDFDKSIQQAILKQINQPAISDASRGLMEDRAREEVERQRTIAQRRLEESLSARGQLGAGVEFGEKRALDEQFNQALSNQLRDLSIQQQIQNFAGAGQAIGTGADYGVGTQGNLVALLRQQLAEKQSVPQAFGGLGGGAAGGGFGSMPSGGGVLGLGGSFLMPGSVGSFNTSPLNPENQLKQANIRKILASLNPGP